MHPQLHLHHDTEIVGATAAERPEEHAFLGVGFVGRPHGHECPGRGDKTDFQDRVHAHTQRPTKRAQAAPEHEAADTHRRASSTIHDLAVQSRIDERSVHLAPYTTTLHDDVFWVRRVPVIQRDVVHVFHIQKDAVVWKRRPRVRVTTILDRDRDLARSGLDNRTLHVRNTLRLDHKRWPPKAIEQVRTCHRTLVFQIAAHKDRNV